MPLSALLREAFVFQQKPIHPARLTPTFGLFCCWGLSGKEDAQNLLLVESSQFILKGEKS
jgi:hypothetical protein